jgi:hypothetical protein
MKYLQILPKPFLYIFLAFILCTIIGTLSHELGHIAVAKSLGYKTTLHYQSMSWKQKADREAIHKLIGKYEKEACNGKPFPGRKAFEVKRAQIRWNKFLVVLGGPLQTMLTGTIGFAILLYRRKKFPLDFNIWNWTGVFLAFFWIRQPCNLLLSVAGKIFGGDCRWFGGDEAKLSFYLGSPSGMISIITGLIGFFIVFGVIFYYIPKKYRLTFIISGLAGGVAGFILWMTYLGPYLLP